MHGLDFGGYTEWRRPENPPKPIDFIVVGVAWGVNKNSTYDYNLPAMKDEKRLMTYGFYHGWPKGSSLRPEWDRQCDVWMELSLRAGSKALWIDFESSAFSPISDQPQKHVARFRNIFNYLEKEFPGKVGFYGGYDKYVTTLKRYMPEIADKPWWVAWPRDKYNNAADWSLEKSLEAKPGNVYWHQRIKPREKDDYKTYQYSWAGKAWEYGATNQKKSMDLNVLNPNFDLDKWLGITDEPEEPPTSPDEAAIRKDERNKVVDEAKDRIEGLRI